MLDKTKDPMGAAIVDYWKNGAAERLRVFSPGFDEDEMPVEVLFREFNKMPEIEKMALHMANGRILDVGAGSGCHSLALQDMGKKVKAIDISGLSVETMKERGVTDAVLQNFYEIKDETFDTILMLMNGAGVIGCVDNMPSFFSYLKTILSPQGQVLMDSLDLRYIFEDEDGALEIDLTNGYYGEVEYQLQYKNIIGERFPWLYIDFSTLQYYAEEAGFKAELILEGEHYDYLAKLYVES